MADYRQFTEDEIKWLNKLQRVMKSAPKDTKMFMFVGAGITIYPERIMTASGGVDGDAPSVTIQTNIETDGGDWWCV